MRENCKWCPGKTNFKQPDNICLKCRKRINIQYLNTVKFACINCGYKKCKRALLFRHRDLSTKLFKISDGEHKTPKEFVEELMKCDLLCSNCCIEKYS